MRRRPYGFALLLLTACAAGDREPDREPGQVPTNGLQLDAAILARIEPAPLSDGWAEELAATAGGAGLLHYVAICALGPDQDLLGEPGYYGLAREWVTEPCTGACRHWVSACLLAHANAFGTSVVISPRGAHPGLASPDPDFTIQEAAFYGDVFTGDERTLEMYACAGRGLTDAEHYLEGRICGVSSYCGLVQTGLCGSLVPATIAGAGDVDLGAACEVDAGRSGTYADCHTGDHFERAPRRSPLVSEVVTVYLHPSHPLR